ncbi:MAG: T9SS type A sorting domain-containing protein, partial [bacterium]|nr:T9SS type A sorting domain-containing protein [Candidatus Limimorpha equi]
REDFNPIPCSVSKIPKEQLEALAFPNPARDEIHFDISGLPAGKEHRISISDAMGRLVMSRIIRGEGNVLTVGIAGFKPGIYTYQIYNAENDIVNGKFVKE